MKTSDAAKLLKESLRDDQIKRKGAYLYKMIDDDFYFVVWAQRSRMWDGVRFEFGIVPYRQPKFGDNSLDFFSFPHFCGVTPGYPAIIFGTRSSL